ncbi:TetR/AcrR family transcriptional regulator [uncultured Maricaulis sp.]|uniref:TetR/AcrR family transcriptional regulator n=1 Tax=uncultured Maricaulis sp. TaxID=174710 RepID=UPI0030DB7C6F|tara:strand:- start:6600 stop:7226 length:627 start_codon:yes stop_codon:yes gene_type:complete
MTGKLREGLFESADPNLGVTAPRGTTKARIERAALQLFACHGMDGVSIKQIAQACTISDGAMYRHFKSKDELARLMFEAIHARLLQLVAANIRADASLEQTVLAVVTAYCELAEDDPAQFTYHLTHRNYFLAASGDGGANPSDVMSARVAMAMERGEIPVGDPELAAAMALGLVMQPAEYRIFGRIEQPMTELIPVFTRAIMAVLRAV